MRFNTFYSENFYFFTSNLSEENCKNLIKFKNISIVYNKKPTSTDINELKKIIKFSKKNKIKIYIKDDINLAKNLKISGIFVSSDYKKKIVNNNNFNQKKNFKIIGSVHSQIEFFFKKKQGCKDVFLSPLFKNQKYTQNKILGINKFNLISKKWSCNLYALGGINLSNIKKVYMTNCKGVGFISFINDSKIKKPVYFLR